MIIKADLNANKLYAWGRVIDISCKVRSEANGQRKLTESPVLSIPDQKPVMPRPFPVGVWDVFKPEPRDSPALAPFFIPTSAYQVLPVWSGQKSYGAKTTETVIDRGYGLHFSTFFNTIGCIKIEKKDDLLFLVSKINAETEKIKLEVYT